MSAVTSSEPLLPRKRVAVVGAGVAGLVCARLLKRQGLEVEVFEAGDAVGGRVRSDEVDTKEGRFILDRGFQILIDAYPEVRRQLDLKALDLQAYAPGAVLANRGVFRIVADPTRRPMYLLRTLFAGIASLRDLWPLLRLRLGHFFSNPYSAFTRPAVTTEAFLKRLGLSTTLVETFLRPFFEAIYVSPLHEQSSACFEFVLRMLADGRACLPARGMRAVPEQLANGLNVRLGAAVAGLRPKAVRIGNDNAEWLGFDAVVLATGWPEAEKLHPAVGPVHGTSSTTWYFSLPSPPPVREPFIILNSALREPGAACLVNVGFSSLVQHSYAPEGYELAAVTVRGGSCSEAWLRGQVAELLGCDVGHWQLLRTYELPFHQPAQVPPGPSPGPVERDGIFLCGDYCGDPTLDGAMRSGCRAAEAVLKSLDCS